MAFMTITFYSILNLLPNGTFNRSALTQLNEIFHLCISKQTQDVTVSSHKPTLLLNCSRQRPFTIHCHNSCTLYVTGPFTYKGRSLGVAEPNMKPTCLQGFHNMKSNTGTIMHIMLSFRNANAGDLCIEMRISGH